VFLNKLVLGLADGPFVVKMTTC